MTTMTKVFTVDNLGQKRKKKIFTIDNFGQQKQNFHCCNPGQKDQDKLKLVLLVTLTKHV